MAGTASVISTTSSGNALIDAILWGDHWSSGTAVTTLSTLIAGQEGQEQVEDGHGASILATVPLAAELAAMAAAMAAVEAVCNIDFLAVSSTADADLVWASVNDADAYGGLGWANPPGVGIVDREAQGLIALNNDLYQPIPGSEFLARGGYDFCSFLNLLGQALGLDVPHEADGSYGFPGEEPGFGEQNMNQGIWTMMSYNDGWRSAPHGPSPSLAWGYQAGPMALDIAALQHLYGVNTSWRAGDDSYALPGANAVGTFYSCLWDAGGTDRILGAAALANVIDLRAATLQPGPGGGGFVSYAAGIHGGFTIAHGAVIENATGGSLGDAITGNGAANHLIGLEGDDTLAGLDGDDSLEGGAGHDILDGGTGSDRLEGGTGDDLYILATPGDTVAEAAQAGTDEVRAAVSHALAANLENLLLTGGLAIDGAGNALGNRLTGNAGANVLLGLDGSDTLLGGAGNDILDGGAGTDRLEGGSGNDIYVMTRGDTLIEGAEAGIDEVRAASSATLRANLENLLLTGTLGTTGAGNARANRLTGNAGPNVLLGLDGNDTLRGGAGHDTLDGGAGNDRLEGGAGNDLYILTAGDSLVEGAGSGIDGVRAAFSLALTANMENLVLTGSLALTASGNAMSNRLTGNAAANALRGLDGNDRLDGAAGRDTLEGGRGHDLLHGNSGADRLTGGPGNDAFLFASRSHGPDVVADFHNIAGDNDSLQIRTSGFGGGLVAGTTLGSGRFRARADNLAQDADDRFIFRTTDRTLWYDADGRGGGEPTLVADLQAGATLSHTDILLVA